jgi:N-acetylneuraminate synthase
MDFLGKKIGDFNPVFIIAEAGINHCGKLSTAIEMIDTAKKCGADAVKFQKRYLETLYRADTLSAPSDSSHGLGVYIPILRQCELSEDDHRKLKKKCDEVGIKYLCSPWDIASVNFLEKLGVEGYKVPSACFSDVFLMDKISETGKPAIISTGMHSEVEIEHFMPRFLDKFRDRLGLMHCVSSYPTPNKDVNLGFMVKLKNKYKIPTGYSGHERGVPVTVAAVAMGANIIERHFTLDRTMPGPDHAASLEPHGLEELVRHVRAVEEAMGDQKITNRGEVMARETLGKILVWARDHKSGDVIDETSFTAMSPGYGIPIYQSHAYMDGRHVLTRDVTAGTPLSKIDAIKNGGSK